MPKFHVEAPKATVSEGLAQGPYMYVAARAGVKLMTIRTKGVDSTNAPHTPHDIYKERKIGQYSEEWILILSHRLSIHSSNYVSRRFIAYQNFQKWG